MTALRGWQRGLTTKQRGLAGEHQGFRQRALATMAEGTACARCAQRGIYHPMTRAVITKRADGRFVAPLLEVDDFPGRAFGGPQVKALSWRRCNRRAGGVLGNRIKAAMRPARPSQYTRW